MKFSILQSDFLPVLNSVSRSVGARATLAVLSNILISCGDGNLKIAATNLEIGIIKQIKVKIQEPGEITIPAKTLVEVVSGLGPVQIDIEVQGETINLTAGKFKAHLTGINANEFPVIPISAGNGVSFKREVLKSCSNILFASAVDEGRPILTGILTQVNSGSVDFVATDGFRLAHQKIKLENKDINFKSLIPRKTFEEIIRILDEEDAEEVLISTSKGDNQAIFKIGQTTVSSRLIEGNFPSWEKIIPTEIKTRSLIDRITLQQAVKLASVFAKSETNVISFDISKNNFLIQSESRELGSQTNEVDAQTEGEDIKIAFNAKFLSDVVSASNNSQVMVEFSGPLSAALVKPVGVEGLEYIIMPVRTA